MGGIRVPKGTREYYFLEVLSDMYLRGDKSLAAVYFVEKRGFLVPGRMVVSGWPGFVDELVDPLIRRSVYENGVEVRAPPALLVGGAPGEYYLAYDEAVGGRG